jgi:hypothetical protein
MLTRTLILASTGLVATSGAALSVTSNDYTVPALESILDLVDGKIERQNITTSALVDPAVRFTAHEGRQCGGWESYYKTSDDGCFLLPPGDGMSIREIADTCRGSFYPE